MTETETMARVNFYRRRQAELVAAAARDVGDELVLAAANRVRLGYYAGRAARGDVQLVCEFAEAIA